MRRAWSALVCLAFVAALTALTLDAGAAQKCGGKKRTVLDEDITDSRIDGTNKDDVIIGTKDAETIDGKGGDDIICALGGGDTLYGRDGRDRLFGGDGADTHYGGEDDDTLNGGPNTDYASWQDSDVGVFASLLDGEATAGVDNEDKLVSIQGLFGTPENDTLVGSNDDDTLKGFSGDDTLRGRGGKDSLEGALGDDLLEGGPDLDDIYGDEGSDVASYKGSTAGIEADLATQKVKEINGGPEERLEGIEGLVGSPARDVMLGSSGNNNLSGLGGNDDLKGLSGIDLLDGGNGDDELDGGLDDDVLIGGANNVLSTPGPKPYENRRSGAGDIVTFESYGVPLVADLKAGTATLGSDSDPHGTDTIAGVESIFGTYNRNDLTGDDGPNVLIGCDINDVLLGEGGNDQLIGLTADDRLVGGLGDDYLEGGAGDDFLVPGRGPSRPPMVGSDDDIVVGGANSSITGDTLDYFDSAGGVTVNLSSGSTTGEGNDVVDGIEWVNGSGFADTLTGDGTSNILQGGNGNDTLNGAEGDDELDGDEGTDHADGGEGGENAGVFPHNGDTCDDVDTHVNCEYVDGAPQDDAVSARRWGLMKVRQAF